MFSASVFCCNQLICPNWSLVTPFVSNCNTGIYGNQMILLLYLYKLAHLPVDLGWIEKDF